MRNVQELERAWIKYKIKSYSLYIVILVFLIILLPFMIFFTPKALHVSENNATVPASKMLDKSDYNSSTKVVKIDQIDQNKTDEKLFLQPSINFINDIENSANSYHLEQPLPPKEPAPKSILQAPIPQVKGVVEVKKPIVKPNPTLANETKTKKIDIEVHSMDHDLQDVAQRFKKTNNPTLGLFLAKKYYDMRQYDLAYNYALLTNQLDSKIDMSWIIFAKSSVKLGQKEKAINTLKSYINNSHSKQAITLLDEIETGHFK